ncbi:hypothetical protein D521_0457 [beta proteobacterium CB]|nr:hypothetical protein D521_0457 [beta proteobacterium CB]
MWYLFAGLAGVAALVVFYFDLKILALALGGVAALFLYIQQDQEHKAKSNAVEAKMDATQANFNVEWAKDRWEDKKTVSALQERANTLQVEADQAKANQRSVEAHNEAIRKPLVDALNRQVTSVAQDDAPPVTLKK